MHADDVNERRQCIAAHHGPGPGLRHGSARHRKHQHRTGTQRCHQPGPMRRHHLSQQVAQQAGEENPNGCAGQYSQSFAIIDARARWNEGAPPRCTGQEREPPRRRYGRGRQRVTNHRKNSVAQGARTVMDKCVRARIAVACDPSSCCGCLSLGQRKPSCQQPPFEPVAGLRTVQSGRSLLSNRCLATNSRWNARKIGGWGVRVHPGRHCHGRW